MKTFSNRLLTLGADAFILAGTPHLEEAYRVGEEVLPLLRWHQRRGEEASHPVRAEPIEALAASLPSFDKPKRQGPFDKLRVNGKKCAGGE